jgi:hypothetical protein
MARLEDRIEVLVRVRARDGSLHEEWWPAHRVLDAGVTPPNPQAAIALIASWLADGADAGEQRETWEYLKQALDADRLSDRKLFP